MNHFAFTSSAPAPSGTIVVAGCGSLADARALSRWLFGELREWPRSAWQMWIADASEMDDIRAARIEDTEGQLHWQDIADTGPYDRDVACRIIAGRFGLILLASDSIVAAAAVRGLAGLVSGLTCFPAGDPIAQPFRKSFASFGVLAGI